MHEPGTTTSRGVEICERGTRIESAHRAHTQSPRAFCSPTRRGSARAKEVKRREKASYLGGSENVFVKICPVTAVPKCTFYFFLENGVCLARPLHSFTTAAQTPQILKSGISLISTEYQRGKFSHLNDHLCNDFGEGRFFDLPDAEKIEVRQNSFSRRFRNEKSFLLASPDFQRLS